MWLSPFFPRANPGPERPPDLFDIYHARTLAAIIDSRGKPLGDWSAVDAESREHAPRFILGLLRAKRALRRRFPAALVIPSRYQEWLLSRGLRQFSLGEPAASNIRAAFSQNLGARVREFYLHTPEVQWRYPLGLLPVGQKRFVKWLVGKGRTQHGFSDEEILWFLHATAEDLPRGLGQTYLLNPDWQERFPRFTQEQKRFLRWMRGEFPKFRPLRSVKSLLQIPDLFDPKNIPDTRGGIGANVLGHFCYRSGLQQAAHTTTAALQSVGVRLSCRDVPAGVRTGLTSREPWLGLEVYPVTIINIAPLPHFESCYRRGGLARRSEVFRIAYWYWELESVPEAWSEFAGLLDEIWAPTPFVAEAMRKSIPLPVHEMLPGVSIGPSRPISREQLGLDQTDYVFLFMFDMNSEMERKNPLGLIRAFRQAFRPDEKARLVIKTIRREGDTTEFERLKITAQQNDIVLASDLASREEAYGYIEMCDCFVSLHRSEGFGLGLAEAMLLGKPVIGTNYSGNLAFMNSDNSLLVDYELVTILESGPIYKEGFRWANPSESHATVLMRQVYENRDEAAARAARAKTEVADKLSVQRAGGRMKDRLRAIFSQLPATR